MNKKLKSIRQVEAHQSLFQCPICHTFMRVHETKSFICQNHHTFDFTRKGYLNLTTRPAKTKYNTDLFESRRELMVEHKLFEPVLQQISEWIQRNFSQKDTLYLLDTGCGEGSHLSCLSGKLQSEFKKDVTGIGIDLSKEGIMVASKNYTENIWAVADLAHSPFQDQSFHILLNILSPSNYAEFKRLLKEDGFVIKVVPQRDYLKELREVFFEDTSKQSYSNEETVELFTRHFQLKDRMEVKYKVDLDSASVHSLIQMTPLTWSIPETHVQSVLEQHSLSSITVDLEILVGVK
ncbi:23S rRNA (guanine745-N1)-methyltransferase [Salinibacillus kushneri]|uniref:23S rRNA (Guanine745-N1)-methyltransferase n=1 Tax=Salinibacillus kushneri TaxID=237682 RepID=A0A1I0I8U6_9BACI|nr:methyltransferase domain-containing protein [Salinibacillus kushneri]SET92990.1 23S rRNA (guanine745-N1)-methyltransferase [Salinibacillus kushneri]